MNQLLDITVKKSADECLNNFVNRFTKGEITDDIAEIIISKPAGLKNIDIITLLTKETGLVSSTSEARRLIKQNAVKVNGAVIDSIDYLCENSKQFLLQVGKKIANKIKID